MRKGSVWKKNWFKTKWDNQWS